MNSQRNDQRCIEMMEQVQERDLVIFFSQHKDTSLHQVDNPTPKLQIPDVILVWIITFHIGIAGPDLPHLRVVLI